MKIKEYLFFLHHFFIYGSKASTKLYIKKLRNKGMKIGNNCNMYSPWTIKIDTQRPWMITIGNNVHIAADVSILQHGYDWAIVQKMSGQVLGSSGQVDIGDNVFIGQGVKILKGVKVGNNTIIGAGSIVTKSLKNNSVYAGNPARYICSIEDYRKKREMLQLNEAIELYKSYRIAKGIIPDKLIFREYFEIFESDKNALIEEFIDVLKLQDNFDVCLDFFIKTKPKFNGYEKFVQYCESLLSER